MSDFTSKYNGYLGIPNEGSGIRVRLENETDNIEYSTTGENLTDFLDNLYEHSHQSLDNVYDHLNDYSNPHHVTAEQIGAVTLENDEIITGNKSFIGKITINDVSFPNGIVLDSNTKIVGDGSALTNVSIPNLVYNNLPLQSMNGSLILNNNSSTSFLQIGDHNGSITLVKDNNGSFVSITNSTKSITIDTNSIVGDHTTSKNDSIGIAWVVPNVSEKLAHIDRNGISKRPSNGTITIGPDNISPLDQYPISLGTNDSPWKSLYSNNIYLGSNGSNESSSLTIESSQSSSDSIFCSNITGSSKISRYVDSVSYSVNLCSIQNDSSNDVSKVIQLTTKSYNNDTKLIDNSTNNNSISMAWNIGNAQTINSGISFTETGVSPIFNGFVDLGDNINRWRNIYSDNLTVNNISINGVDLDTKLNSLTPELPSNLVYTDSEKPQSLSSSLSIINDNGSFTVGNQNNGAYVLIETNKNNNPTIALTSHLNDRISSRFELKRDTSNTGTFLAYWQIPNQSIDKRNSNGTFTNQGASPFAYAFFTNGAITPDENYPISLGTVNNRWHNVCTAILNAESIVIDGKDLTKFVKDTMSSEIEIIKERIEAGNTSSFTEMRDYIDTSIQTLSSDVDEKISNIDTSVVLTDEIKQYIDDIVIKKCEGITTSIAISSQMTNDENNIVQIDTTIDSDNVDVYTDNYIYEKSQFVKIVKED